jgi:hypothetical protein
MGLGLELAVVTEKTNLRQNSEPQVCFFQHRIKATPHKDRLPALLHICLHIFRHINQKLLDLRQ